MAEYSQPSFSISIEEEYQFVDPDSRELRGFATAQGSRSFTPSRRERRTEVEKRVNRPRRPQAGRTGPSLP